MALPITIRYFRFEPITIGGITFPAPVNYAPNGDYYSGYDITPYVISYSISRNIDMSLDTFTIVVDKTFFRNPTANPAYLAGQTDPENSFQPTSNHVVVIGNPPNSVAIGTNNTLTDGNSDSFMFEDQAISSSPVFCLVNKATDQGADLTSINCVSFLKSLDAEQLNTDFILNNNDDSEDALQVFFEYTGDSYSSSPYFAAKDTTSFDNNVGRYRIALPSTLTGITYVPHYPEVKINVTDGITATELDKTGYESPKIAWRLLQEKGWCRKNYLNEVLSNLGAVTPPSPAINPYQPYTISSTKYNQHTMDLLSTTGGNSKVYFTSFDTDGLRWDYTYLGTDSNPYTNFNQTYMDSFDPSKQSILYNLKTIAENDNLFINATCCPRIVKYDIVWDYKVYQEKGVATNNLYEWGIYAGFHPKMLIRRSPKDYNEDPTSTLEYGTYSSDPTSTTGATVLVNEIHWEEDRNDMINKILIKYGQNASNSTAYLQLPTDDNTPFFVVNFYGVVGGSPVTVDISLQLAPLLGLADITGTYNLGTVAADIASDLSYNSVKYIQMVPLGDSLIIKPDPAYTATEVDYWSALPDGRAAITVSFKYSAAVGTELFYNVEYINPVGGAFDKAVISQKKYGVVSQKISMPEIQSMSDAVKMCNKTFERLAYPKYRCTTQSNKIDNGELPIFGYYNILDNSNLKQVPNDVGASVILKLKANGTLGAGHLTIMYPMASGGGYKTASIPVVANDSIATVCATAFTLIGADVDPVCTVDGATGTIKLTYDVNDVFTTTAFDSCTASSNVPNLSVLMNVITYQPFKSVAYDEDLLMMQYDTTSTKGIYNCTFGLPAESVVNIINQYHNWIGDVEKAL